LTKRERGQVLGETQDRAEARGIRYAAARYLAPRCGQNPVLRYA
jgi:hypothetical protein